MKMHELKTLRAVPLNTKGYAPNNLFDWLIEIHDLRNDAALAKALKIHPAVISKARHYLTPVSAELILRIHDVFEVPVSEIRTAMGLKLTIKKFNSKGA
jgi:hypothetical protein